MSVFSHIKAKLGFSDEPEDVVTDASAAADTTNPATSRAAPLSQGAIGKVDIMSRLEQLASTYPETLNWKTSIVDLLKLLGLDSSLASRKELATELGCPTEKMGDSARMNIWLHQAVLKKLAENGGNIPDDLLR